MTPIPILILFAVALALSLALTPFARWAGQLGLWPLWLLGAALLALFALHPSRPRG